MNIKIKYFGLLAETIGASSELLEVEEGCTAAALLEQLKSSYPELQQKSFKLAINHRLAVGEEVIGATDELALLPPFAGG